MHCQECDYLEHLHPTRILIPMTTMSATQRQVGIAQTVLEEILVLFISQSRILFYFVSRIKLGL